MKFAEIPMNATGKGDLLVVDVVSKDAKGGQVYIEAMLSDGDEIVKARCFFLTETEFPKKGDVAKFSIAVSEYNGTRNYKIIGVEPADKDVTPEMFVVHAPLESEAMYNAILETVSRFENEDLRNLCTSVYEKFKNELLRWSAAKSMHHSYCGGLLYHTYRMMLSIERLCEVYTSVNKEIALAAGMLHDIGKLKELETDEFGVASYSVDGNLFGHPFIGAEIVKHFCCKLGVDKEIERQVTHCIVSHHSNAEWGAIKTPMTLEAFVVATADYFDSQFTAMEEEVAKTEEGEFSQNKILDGITVYRPVTTKNEEEEK